MTLKEFDDTIGNLIKVVLPPSCNDDPPIMAEGVIAILEKHIEDVRSTIITYPAEDPA